MTGALAAALLVLGLGSPEGPLEVPIPAGSESRVLALAAPYELAKAIDGGPCEIWNVAIGKFDVSFEVSPEDGAPAATVHVDVRKRSVTLSVAPDAIPRAREAAEKVAARIRAALGDAVIDERGPSDDAGGEHFSLEFAVPITADRLPDAHRLILPYEATVPIGDGPFAVSEVILASDSLAYPIAAPGLPARVTVRFDARTREVGVETAEGAEAGAVLAAGRVAQAMRRHIGAAPAVRVPGGGDFLVVALALALVLVLVRPRGLLPRVPRRAWIGLGALTIAAATVLWGLEDVVAHPNAHGWTTVRALVAPIRSPYSMYEPYGDLHVVLARVLGAFAAPGHETFAASRVAVAATVPLLFLLGLAVFERPWVALGAAALWATLPVVLFVGRAETVTGIGLALALFAALVVVLAAQTRCLRLLLAASLALGVLANFRLMGLVLAVPVALLVLSPPSDRERTRAGTRRGWRWWPWVAAGLACAAAMALPHGLGVLDFFAAGPPRTRYPEPNLLSNPLWTPVALTGLALAGALLVALRRPIFVAAAAAWAVVAIVLPSGSTGCWLDQARYQVFAVPPLVILTAAALGEAWRRVAGPWALGLTLAAVAWWAAGATAPYRAMAEAGIDTAQLRLWRQLETLLPEGATLIVPVENPSGGNPSLPDAELLAARPDVRVVDLAHAPAQADLASGAPVFWFEPVACHFGTSGARGPDSGSDCVLAARALRRTPVAVEALWNRLDPEIAAVAGLGPGDWQAWSFYVTREDPVTLGLYRVDGWR